MKIAIRGYGNQAKKIEKILKSINKVEIYKISRDFLSNELQENTKGIIICSPNATHKKYIDKSLSFNPNLPIYCEKPILNSSLDFSEIAKFTKTGRLFPGFNLRRSKIVDLVNKYKNKLGDIKNMMINQSYPFGLKKSYSHSWKSNYKFSNLGIMENLTIHYIDLSYYLFGKEEEKKIILTDFINSVPRNCDVLIKHKKGVITSIHNSYSEILNSKIELNFDNGKIVIDHDAQEIFFPTLNLDLEKDFCLQSPLIFSSKENFEEIFTNSLKNSVNLFIEKIRKKSIHLDDSSDTTFLTLKALSETYSRNIHNH